MKNKTLVLIVGESTGFECLKKIINLNIMEIDLVVSTDKNYHLPIKKICNKSKIRFINSNSFKKLSKHIKFNNKKKYVLISIFSNLILNKSFLKKFKRRAYNVHPGLLPYYPGKNCVSGALYNNEKNTGVTLHLMINKIDRGPIIKQYKIKIQRNDNLLKLINKLKLCSVKLINSFINDLHLNKKMKLKKNNINLIKFFPKNT